MNKIILLTILVFGITFVFVTAAEAQILDIDAHQGDFKKN